MVTLDGALDAMVSELKVTVEEARVYMLLLSGGRMARERIAGSLNLDSAAVDRAVRSLVEKGALIEMDSAYEALNPRFALTNIYRMMCHTGGIESKRNIVVDQLATLLEKVYEDARAKTK